MSFIQELESWQPHDYQKLGITLMVEHGACGLFLDPGLGKTSITLASFTVLQQQKYASRMLVIAPMRVCYNVWPNEVKKWKEFSHLKVVVLHGKDKEDKLSEPADVYVINPEGLPWLAEKSRLDRIKPDVLVVDESTKFKRPKSKRFKLLKQMLPKFNRRYILTGTPTSQGLEDLFGQIYILDGGVALGKYITHFRNKYFYQEGFGGYTYLPREGAEEEIAQKLAGFTLRLKAEDYLEMPEKVFNSVAVTMPDHLRDKYKELEREFIVTLGEVEILAPSAAAVSNKLRQFVNGFVYDEDKVGIPLHTAKADALVDLHEEINQAPLLVLYEFVYEIEMIAKAFGKKVPHIGSGVNNNVAESLCRQFNDGTLKLLLAHPASVGHGLNLQGCSNHVAFFGLPWDYEIREQAIRRIYRQGNPNTHVFIHDIIVRGTIDMSVRRALNRKESNQEDFLRALTKYSGE